jgi:hypothetical protein
VWPVLPGQLEQYVGAEEMSRDYAYFSSYSDSWLAPRAYVEMITTRLRLHHNRWSSARE